MMKPLICRIGIMSIIVLLNTSIAFAWTTYSDPANGFHIDFPCTPQKMGNTTNGYDINVYNCEESLNDNLISYHVYITSKSNGDAIPYKQSDVVLALKNYVIGGFQTYGLGQENITFQTMPNFQNKFPAVYYYTNVGGIAAEGISSLIDGKLVRLGVMYKTSFKTEAQNRLQFFLNSFKQK